MFAIWANICWLSCCSLGSMAWLLHQSVWWLGFPCMQMWDAFISLLLFSPAMAELTLCSDVSPNAWCPFISLHSWVLLFCWRIVLLLLLIVLRTSMAIIYSTSIFWKFFFFFMLGNGLDQEKFSSISVITSLFILFLITLTWVCTTLSALSMLLPLRSFSDLVPPNFVLLKAFPPYYLSSFSSAILIA